jgi:ribosome-associated protein
VNFRQLAKKIALLLRAEKAEKIVILDVRKLTFLTDYFFLANATSSLHLTTLRETLNENLSKENISPLREDGVSSSSWQVLDYGGLIVHLFLPEIRNFYNLEKFWKGAKMVSWETTQKRIKKRQIAKKKTIRKYSREK